MLTNQDCKRMMDYFISALKRDTELQDVMAKAMRRTSEPDRRLVRLAEAAGILGISRSQLYHIKDREDGSKRFSYVKTGNVQSSPVLFDASRLIDEYKQYLAEKSKIRRMKPLKAAVM